MTKIKYASFVLAMILFFAFSGFAEAAPQNFMEKLLGQIANIVFPATITPQDLRDRYSENNVKILLVPGHDNEYRGTEYGFLRESDMNLEVARHLYGILAKDNHFVVSSARDLQTGEYSPELASYFKREEDSILAFRERSKAVMDALLFLGIAEEKSMGNHGFATEEVSRRLYGINKWSNENGIDITLHLHFNNYPRKNTRVPGKYQGFAIYVPERQYPNSEASIAFVKPLYSVLKKYLPVSDIVFEKDGIIEDQELIAVGANASREGAAVLLEYGYIYETKFTNAKTRGVLLPELAHLTYTGIKKYFEPDMERGSSYETSLLPYRWADTLDKTKKNAEDIFPLQAALLEEGVYPPPGKDFHECPISGVFGACTKRSVELFQEKYRAEILEPFGLNEGTGIVGTATLRALNKRYGVGL